MGVPGARHERLRLLDLARLGLAMAHRRSEGRDYGGVLGELPDDRASHRRGGGATSTLHRPRSSASAATAMASPRLIERAAMATNTPDFAWPTSIAGKPPLPPPASFQLGGRAFIESLRRTRLRRRRTGSANSVCSWSGSICLPAGPPCTRTSPVRESEPGSRARTCACHAPRASPSIRAKWGPSPIRCHPFIRAAAACSWRYPWSPPADVANRTSDRARESSERPPPSALESLFSHAHTVRCPIRGVGCPVGIHPVDLRILRLRDGSCRPWNGRCASTLPASGLRVNLVLRVRRSGTVAGLLPRFLITSGHVGDGRNIGVNDD